ncbi:hypothetical protein CH373_17645 [Leptospira perolatii]|uniref:FAD-binding domain-containing protein n=1 Tax=Leptospira perolatii TaxID=2023191 RepID=A0A2M9ZIB3_9LEPT|nr:hypothetical protein [Leptospira perolatii]PJZ69096.1 hypothetical protein CH360_12490 [Leptospira perolatii]PJZ71805.1 hypothetical protein CH373_17645 [Leptospira perolatii]
MKKIPRSKPSRQLLKTKSKARLTKGRAKQDSRKSVQGKSISGQESSKPYGDAIVIGCGIGGLMAARALADFFKKVTVLDRDKLPSSSNPRQGVPQGKHPHVLLNSGKDVIESFFPGMIEELRKEGLNVIDSSQEFIWHHFGVWKSRFRSGVHLMLFTRPFLEWNLRKRLKATYGVEFIPEKSVEGLLSDVTKRRITGVRLSSGKELFADLIVDASGRGSRCPQWLESLGYPKPFEEKIGIDLAYTSFLCKAPKNFDQNWKLLIEYPKSPDNWRAGFISCVEGNRWLVSLNGYFKDHAPTNQSGFMNFAKTLTRPNLYNFIKYAKPITDITIFKIPTNRWRRFDRLSDFPENLVPFADSVCALNPIFGQGISVASLQSKILHDCLMEQFRSSRNSLKGFANRVRKRLPNAIKLPWFLTKTLDLHYPQATGSRPFGHSILMWYINRMMELMSVNQRIYYEYLWTIHLKKSLWNIIKPSVSLTVLWYGILSFFVPLEKRANTDRIPIQA